jgi:hypothetical protein
MADFPRTAVGGVSVSRFVIGTNWLLGFSHQTKAKDDFIKAHQTRERIAEILRVFFAAGIDTILGVRPESPHLLDAIKDVEQATGRKCIMMATPHLNTATTPEGFSDAARTMDAQKAIGAHFCMPHQATTDSLVNRRTRQVEGMDRYCRMIRERGMIPGLSTHMPETPKYADGSKLDVETYIQIYNAAGFLMQIEVDWVHRMIWQCSKPVLTIKPMAAGRLPPLAGMAFAWATIRPQDMVCAGVMTPDEARELIDISLSVLDRRAPEHDLQRTRSKQSM